MMRLVEKHLIRKSDPRFAVIDRAAFASKNLYNQANYQIRQAYIHEGKYLPSTEIFHRLKPHEAYCALPRKVSNSILIQLHKNWIGFFEGIEAYKENPSQFTGRPCLPGYKDKEKGRFLLIYDKQALGKSAFKKTGKLGPSRLPIDIATKIAWEAIAQVRIVPRSDGYMVEVVYEQEERQAEVDPDLVAAAEPGGKGLGGVNSPKPGCFPRVGGGKPPKTLHQHYKKHRSR